MIPPHIDHARRLAEELAIRGDPAAASEAISRLRTIDHLGSVPARQVAAYAVVAAARRRDEREVLRWLAAMGPLDKAGRERLREILLAAPEAANPAYASYAERLTSPPRGVMAAAASRGAAVFAWWLGGLVAGALAIGGVAVVGSQLGWWQMPSWTSLRSETPEQAMRGMLADFLSGDLVAAWDRLPPSWQRSADDAGQRLLQSIDSSLLESIRGLIEAQAILLARRRDFVIASDSPLFVWVDRHPQGYDRHVEALLALARGPLLEADSLGRVGIRTVLRDLQDHPATSAMLREAIAEDFAAEMGIPRSLLRRPDAKEALRGEIGAVLQSESKDRATVRIFIREEEWPVAMILEEGRWISEDLLAEWEQMLAEMRLAAVELRSSSTSDAASEAAAALDALAEEFLLLAESTSQEQFDRRVDGMAIRLSLRLWIR